MLSGQCFLHLSPHRYTGKSVVLEPCEAITHMTKLIARQIAKAVIVFAGEFSQLYVTQAPMSFAFQLKVERNSSTSLKTRDVCGELSRFSAYWDRKGVMSFFVFFSF